MQLTKRDWYSAGAPPLLSIPQTTEATIDGTYCGEYSGQIESLEYKVQNLTKLLGTLIEALNKRGSLTNSDVVDLFPDYKMAFPAVSK